MTESDATETPALQKTPYAILLISGKRKSGKDHAAQLLQSRLKVACNKQVSHKSGDNNVSSNNINDNSVAIIHVAEPIKTEWARRYNLNLEQLMGSSPMKEQYRREMVAWGDEQRDKNPDIFCLQATQPLLSANPSPLIWILADARQESDLNHFIKRYSRCRCIIIRMVADETTRKSRGWQYIAGIDDERTECGLDKWTDWDFIINNNNSDESNDNNKTEQLNEIFKRVISMLPPFSSP